MLFSHSPRFTAEETARERVRSEPKLAAHEAVILNYDQPDWDEHLEWVIAAPVGEILNWLAETDGS